ncbi:hypothetical protein QR680_011673 [Steinernema hermaphroditum]|uniref:ZP domain-containing protein n=1 Tax=Steinernema hermaphroditum TaxID=289476 RepID=A0AA39I1T5_9BILA|nr:hypothetical protein QR680_011673 [Steinernema hermaphroditum]
MKTIIVLSMFAFVALAQEEMRHVEVNGILLCQRLIYKGALVELYEYHYFFADDFHSSTYSDNFGWFELHEDKAFTGQPYLVITHRCGVEEEGKCIRCTVTPYRGIGSKIDFSYLGLDFLSAFEEEADCPTNFGQLPAQ